MTRSQQLFVGLALWILLILGWHPLAHATTSPILEVVGQLEVRARLKADKDVKGHRVLSGELRDENGHPSAGTMHVLDEKGVTLQLRPCSADPSSPRKLLTVKEISIPPSGEICASFRSSSEGVTVTVQAPHFISVRKVMTLETRQVLPSPHFVSLPETINIGSLPPSPSVVEILPSSGGELLPTDSKILLRLSCHGSALKPLGEKSSTAGRLLRFEFTLNPATPPGACEFIAESQAESFSSKRTARKVLLRGQVSLSLQKDDSSGRLSLLEIEAKSFSTPVLDGVVEARENGAFLASAPVQSGRAVLEIDRTQEERSVTIHYLPSGAALVAGKNLLVVIPPIVQGKGWLGLNALGLLLFSGWLTYAWLKPGDRRLPESEIAEPHVATVRSSAERTGRIEGVVRDAHTGASLKDVKLLLLRPGPESAETIEQCVSSVGGRFQFSAELSTRSVLKIQVTHPNYMRLSAPITGPTLTVLLTERRRAAVSGLLEWARAKGAPWYKGPPPTPGELQSTARKRGLEAIELWAGKVAAAAYSGQEPSEEVVNSLRSPSNSPSTTNEESKDRAPS